MRYPTNQKALTRARVVRAAASIIRTQGPDRVGVASVMAKAGMTHGGFYAHFESKDDLVLEAIQHVFDAAQGNFFRRTDGLAPRAGLKAYVDFYLSPPHRDARDTGCPLPLLASDMPRLPEHAREGFGAGVSRLTALVQGLLEKFDHPSPRSAAASAMAEMIGAVAMARSILDPRQSDEVLALSHASVIERLHLTQAGVRQ